MSEIIRLSKAVSRAELVQWLVQSGEDAASLQQIAALAGFEWQEKPLLEVEKVQKEKKRSEDKQIPFVQLEDKPPIPVLPPAPKAFNARWFRVAKRERLPQQDDNGQSREPLSIQGIEDFSAQDLQPGSTPPLALAPLLRWERLWPVLKQGFSSTMPGAIDIPRLVGQVARGGVLENLPRQQRPHWAAESLILLDYNPRVAIFGDDFNRLVLQLKQLRGGAGLQVLKQQGLPGLRYTRWRSHDKRPVDWVMPAPETPILILSDLGMLEPSGIVRKHWLHFGRELKAAGLQPFVLAPVSPHHIDPELSRYYHIALWDRSSRLLRQQQRAETDNKARLEQLLALLSPNIRIEPELLRAVRHLLADTAFDAGLEAEFWQHPAVDKSSIACAVKPQYVEPYRQQFKGQPPALQREVLKLIRQHHAHLFPSVMHYETLLWSVLVSANLADEFKMEIDQAELFLRKTAKMLYNRREYLDDSRKAYGKRTLDSSHEELLRQHPCLAVFEGVVNADQLTKGLMLRPGIDRQELERTLAKGSGQTRECLLYQRGDELMLAEKGGNQSGSFISEVVLTNDMFCLRIETLGEQISESIFYWDAEFYEQALDGIFLATLEQHIKAISLRSGNEELVIEGFAKPVWVNSIGRDNSGLWIDFYEYDKKFHIYWPAWNNIVDLDNIFWIAEKFLEHDDYLEAKNIYINAIDFFRGFSGGYNNKLCSLYNSLGEVLRLGGDYVKAKEYYGLALKLLEETGDVDLLRVSVVLMNLGDVSLSLSQNDVAISSILRALDLLKKELGNNSLDVFMGYQYLASAYEKMGMFHEAEALYNKILTLADIYDADSYDSLKGLAGIYVRQNRYSDAEHLYEKVLSMNPLDVLILKDLADLYVKQCRYSDAEHLYEKVLSMNPLDVLILKDLASLHVKQGRYSDAEHLYEKILSMNPLDVLILKDLASLYVKQGRYSDAEHLYEKILSMNPSDALVLKGLADLYVKQDRYSDAGNLYEKALLMRPENTSVLKSLADMYVKQGRYFDAEILYKKASFIDPKNADILKSLSELYIEQGRYVDVSSLYEKAFSVISSDLNKSK